LRGRAIPNFHCRHHWSIPGKFSAVATLSDKCGHGTSSRHTNKPFTPVLKSHQPHHLNDAHAKPRHVLSGGISGVTPLPVLIWRAMVRPSVGGVGTYVQSEWVAPGRHLIRLAWEGRSSPGVEKTLNLVGQSTPFVLAKKEGSVHVFMHM
jgi:hypothetical protein